MPKLHTNGIDTYYEAVGDGPPILFIHGLGSSTKDWEGQVPFFSNRFRVVAYDVRGHGKSDKPAGPYSIGLFAADSAELIRGLRISPAHVVGLSMGGMIAFQLAVSAPELLRSLTIVNSGPELVLRSLKERLLFFQRRLIVRSMGMRRMGKVLGERLFPKPEQEGLRKVFIDRWAENDKRAYMHALKALTGWSVVDRLSTISCPTLIIAADHDYTPVSVKRAYCENIPRAELVVIEDSRHMSPVERPQEINRALMDFLQRQP